MTPGDEDQGDSLLGRTLGGCRLERELGRGGMGVVYLAEEEALGRKVAVKVLPPQFTQDALALKRFQREARAASRLKSPHIATIHQIGRDGGVHFLVMEVAEGGSVAERLRRESRLPETEAIRIFAELLEALEAAHGAGITHRDVKPENLLIADDGRTLLADFGIAGDAVAGEGGTTTIGTTFGSPYYMAPELWDGAKATVQSDLFAAGVTFSYLLTGGMPFGGTSPTAVMKAIVTAEPDLRRIRRSDLRELVGWLLAKDPLRRPPSAAAARDALAGRRRAPVIGASAAGRIEKVPETGTASAVTRRRLALLLFVVGVTLIGSVLAIYLQGRRGATGGHDDDRVVRDTGAKAGPPMQQPPAPRKDPPERAPEKPSSTPALPVARPQPIPQSSPSATHHPTPPPASQPAPLVAAKSTLPPPPPPPPIPQPKPEPDRPVAPPPSPPPLTFAERLAKAEALARADTLAAVTQAVVLIEQLIAEEPNRADLRATLTGALRARADRELQAGKALEAWRSAQRADDLEASVVAKDLRARAEKQLEEKILPATTIERPKAGEILQSAKLTVVGRTTDSRVTEVRVNGGRPAKVFGLFECEAAKPLAEGPQEVLVELILAEGPVIRKSIPLLVDLYPPELAIESPGEGATCSGQVSVTVRVRDAKVARVTVAGAEAHPTSPAATRTADSRATRGDMYTCSVALPEGNQRLTVEATDVCGRTSTASLRVIVDRTSPRVTVSAPSNGTITRQDTVTITGRVDDPAAVVEIGDRPATVAGDGAFSSTVTLAPNAETTIRIRARDKVQNESVHSLSMIHDATPPEVTIEAPSEGGVVYGSTVRLRGMANDPHTPCTLVVDGKPVPVSTNGRWVVEVEMAAGEHTFEVSATDAVGNTSPRLRRRVRLQPQRLLDWADAKAGAQIDLESGLPQEVTERVYGIQMVLIPAGSFTMGASPGDNEVLSAEHPTHSVTISRPFYLGKYEVTNEEFNRLFPTHDSRYHEGIPLNGGRQPVVMVSWFDAQVFCSRAGLRLPTEAEWEYAARARTTTKYPWGDDPDCGCGWANAPDQKAKRNWSFFVAFNWNDGYAASSPVGSFRPNAFGLHDVIGNAWEWCEDAYDTNGYPGRSGGVVDPTGPAFGAGGRVVRGGCWGALMSQCRSSHRREADPKLRNVYYGFRVARTP